MPKTMRRSIRIEAWKRTGFLGKVHRLLWSILRVDWSEPPGRQIIVASERASKMGELSERQRALLVFLGSGESPNLDPVRIMKGLFLLTMETPNTWLSPSGRYRFEPYHYGPFSIDVYQDLDVLDDLGYLDRAPVPGQSWCHYSLTPGGKSVAAECASGMDQRLLCYMAQLRKYVTDLSFRSLLKAVYDRYPAYAEKSVFARA
ncbi:MAG: hypothetical protein M1274_15370 [Actinobacteria bacterium]|nr:hypothetical protein [Actinomycetota bacterium]